MDEDLFKELYQYAIGLLFDGEIDDEQPTRVDIRNATRLTYRLNDGSPPLEVVFVPWSANYYAIARDGIAEFVMRRSKVEPMLNEFAEAAAP